MRFESIIRKIAEWTVYRKKDLARHHLKRILPYYDTMTDIEKEVVDALRLRLFC